MSSKIEWTEETWNPVVGCDKVSDGCKNCYAIKQAYRMMHMPHNKDKYAGTVKKTEGGALNWTGQINIDEASLMKPLKTKKPTVFFVNSMSDLFHKDVPFDFVDKVFAIMALCPQHTFQVLTKRPERMVEYFKRTWYGVMTQLDMMGDEDESLFEACCRAASGLPIVESLPNVWLGVSVENQKTADERIPLLLQVPAAVRWLSMEPLLGAVDLSKWTFFDHCPEPGQIGEPKACIGCLGDGKGDCQAIWKSNLHWVVAGGESGHDARPMHPDWVRSIRDQCKSAGVPFFFKQWGEWVVSSYENMELHKMGTTSMPDDDPRQQWLSIEGKTQRGSAKSEDKMQLFGTEVYAMMKVGKKAAGRKLDGVVHDEYPKVVDKGS